MLSIRPVSSIIHHSETVYTYCNRIQVHMFIQVLPWPNTFLQFFNNWFTTSE